MHVSCVFYHPKKCTIEPRMNQKPILLSATLVVISAVFCTFALAKSNIFKRNQLVPPSPSPAQVQTSCQRDSDCVASLDLSTCCSCPTVVSKNSLSNTRVVYRAGTDYSQQKPNKCRELSCSPCSQSGTTPVTCQNNLCQFNSSTSTTE